SRAGQQQGRDGGQSEGANCAFHDSSREWLTRRLSSMPLSGMLVYKLAPVNAPPGSEMPRASLKSAEAAPSLEAFEVDRKLPAAEQVYRGLREAIITCRLEPNEAISENRLCGLFGVSRSPVRTAITRLAEDGLIDIFPQRGTFVAPIKLRQVREA